MKILPIDKFCCHFAGREKALRDYTPRAQYDRMMRVFEEVAR